YGGAGPALRGTPRGRHRAVGYLDRTGRIPGASRYHQEELGRICALPAQNVDYGDVQLRRRILVHATAHHLAEAVSEAASMSVGGGHERRDGTRCRGPGSGKPGADIWAYCLATAQDKGV